jgi:hypothetical protein
MENKQNNYKDLTAHFSVDKLDFGIGTITKDTENKTYSIIIPISKFILDEQIVDTTIWLSRIILAEPLENYIEKTITFPINPIEGYIDGSTYLRDAHNPVDVSEIHFIKMENEILTFEMTMNFVFEFEGIGFKNETLKKILTAKIEK